MGMNRPKARNAFSKNLCKLVCENYVTYRTGCDSIVSLL